MKRSQVLQQATVLFLLAFATPSLGNGDQLKNWMDSAKGVSVIVEPSVLESYQEIEAPDTNNIVLIEQNNEIKAAKGALYNDLIAYSGEPQTSIDPDLESATNYLPWDVDKAMILHLDHETWGSWYFTSPLSGCDVWIAEDGPDGSEPLTIHINGNHLAGDPAENLRYKQNLAMEAITFFNNYKGQEYKFIQRISYDYANDPDTSQPQRDEVNEYWNEFKENAGIPYALYLTSQGFFYGTYKVGVLKSQWNFVLKELIKGDILLQISCSVTDSSCLVQ